LKRLYKDSTGLFRILLAVAGTAYAQQSHDVVQSDVKGNAALGTQALLSDTVGSLNTAAGQRAMLLNTTGSFNSAFGYSALALNVTGSDNAAFGIETLASNTAGADNTAAGFNALYLNTSGNANTALGLEALYSNTSGSNNIAVGAGAGYALTTGTNDIDIGNIGRAGESNTVRIGTSGVHKEVYIAGINGAAITGSAVYITPTGQLGVLESSERFKTAIAPMGSTTSKVQQLRPVTFHFKSDPRRVRQYGLIAEEVAQVYPELILRDQSGRVQGIRYEELAPILLKELQLQQHRIAAQAAQLHELKQQLAEFRVALEQQVSGTAAR
jgi:Chaperone of endosialidase